MAKIIVDELVTLISMVVTKKATSALKQTSKSIKSIRRLAIVATGALSGLAFSMNKIVAGVDQQAKFADGIGVTFENLQKLQFAGQKAGASVQEMNSFLETLTKTMSSTKPGEFNSVLFQLGVSVRDANNELKPASKLLLEISDTLSGMSHIRRQQFGARLGASPNIVNALAQGSTKILADMREAERIGGVIPERLKTQAAALLDDSLLRLRRTILGFSRVLTLSLAPELIQVVDHFQDWILTNKELIATRVGEFLSGFVTVLKNMNIVLGVALALLTAFVVEAAIAAGPFIALGAAIAVLVFNIDKLKEAGKAIINLWGNLFPSAANKASDAVDKTTESIKKQASFLNKLATSPLISPIISPIKSLNELSELAASSRLDAGAERFPILSRFIGEAERSITNNVTVNVNGSDSPREVAIEVKKQIDLASAVHTSSPGFNRPKVG